MIDTVRTNAARRSLRVPTDQSALRGLNSQLDAAWIVHATDVGVCARHSSGVTVETNTRNKTFVIFTGDGSFMTDGHGRDWKAIASVARAYVS